jgi:3-deoxy-7-phosphoheptulonate synthase
MIDFSHANSLKQPERQKVVCSDVATQIAGGDKSIVGVMIESHLNEGNQKLGGPESLNYGQSITDACINWEDTVDCLQQLARASHKRSAR